MYKTILQELCHQRTWSLPEYDTMKEGPDHDPRFQATVTVNGIYFHCQSPARSSKQAQNDAAKLAVDHFSSSRPPRPPPLHPPTSAPPASSSKGTDLNNSNLSSGPTLQSKVEETNQISQGNEAPITNRSTDTQHLFKNQLQSYAQKKGIIFPVYSFERVGPSHARRFKGEVIVDGQTYESQEFFSTISKAEQAAAEVALMSLAPNGLEEDETVYKNLLQELAQKEYFCLPVYDTSRSGEAHRPNFTSTVKVGGKSFTGQDARTKKQAELSAAKVAYTTLKQRKSRQSPIVSSSGNSSDNPVVSSPRNSSPMITNSSNAAQSLVSSCIGNLSQSAPSPIASQQGEKVGQFTPSFRSDLSAYLQKNVQPGLPRNNKQVEEKREIAEVVSPYVPIPSVKRISSPSSDSSTSSTVIVEHPAETNIQHHNKVIVHPRGTTMTYPPRSTVLSVSDGNWVAVRTTQSSR